MRIQAALRAALSRLRVYYGDNGLYAGPDRFGVPDSAGGGDNVFTAGGFGGFVFTYGLFRGKLPISVVGAAVAVAVFDCCRADYCCPGMDCYAGSSLDGAVFAVVIFAKGYQMKLSLKVFIVGFLLFGAGCAVVSSLSTETSSERKVPAEYNLKTAGHEKIMVYVRSKKHNRMTFALRGYLTGAINARLGSKTVTSKKTAVISYAQLQKFFAASDGSLELPPHQTAKALGADAVLVVDIVDYKLSAITGSNLYTGLLQTRSTLYDSAGESLWPISGTGKSVAVGFDVESGEDQALSRLVNTGAHCIVRYFYNCPKDQFKIFEESAGVGADSW